MLTVRELREKLNFLLKENYIKDDDVVLISGVGQETRPVNDITAPKVVVDEKVFKRQGMSLFFTELPAKPIFFWNKMR